MSQACHIWDFGLIRRWYHAGGPRPAKAFADFVEKTGRQAKHILVCRDLDFLTWRHELFPAYKQNRKKDPVEAAAIAKVEQEAAEIILDFAEVLGAPGFEADDVVATASASAFMTGFDVTVFTGDKDMLPLMGTGVTIHDGRKTVTKESVIEKYGVTPSQMFDYLSIVGDAVDGVPGVKGMGPVAAKALIAQYGTLAAALEASVAPPACDKLLTKLAMQREEAELSMKLVSLRTDVLLGFPWDPEESC